MTAWQHDLHAHPELSMLKVRTSSMVREKLAEFGEDEIVTRDGDSRGCSPTIGCCHRVNGRTSSSAAAPSLFRPENTLILPRRHIHPRGVALLSSVQQQGYQASPAGLVGGAEALARVAVEKLVEQHVIAKMPIVLLHR